MFNTQFTCPICRAPSAPLAAVDFSKSCLAAQGKSLPPANIPVYYFLCSQCQFCFAPEFAKWQPQDFAEKIYNRDYVLVDPDYVDARPRNTAQMLIANFQPHQHAIKHLDFGGGNGLLSRLLRQARWQSTSYDRFVDHDVNPASLGRFDLITAIEVFEHVPNVSQLIATLASLLAPNGLILFTTLVSDGNIAPGQPLHWWYAAPRNGHVSLFSKKSLALLGATQRFHFASFSPDCHAYSTQIPPWATHLFGSH